jgi:HAAS domain-containing protein
VIETYLRALDAELSVPRRQRARILAEVEDHLRESGSVGSFGDPRELAAHFHEQLASAGARRASWRTALLVALFAAVAVIPASDFPYGLLVLFGGQLALVACALGLARALRYRGAEGVPAERLADVYRANGLAVACVGIGGLSLAIDAPNTADAGLAGATLIAAAVAGWSVARSVARARMVPPAGPPDDDAYDDLLALLPPLPPLARVAAVARRHPWWLCATFAAACGAALAASHAISDGGFSLQPADVGHELLAGLVIAAIEATAVALCFATFGRFLGIRR